MDDAALLDRCTRVLEGNWEGTHTVPAGDLYPHQWNWDSAFAAMGHLAAGRADRGWQELGTLLSAQDATGFVPHIAFSREPGEYLPGPEWWGPRRGGDGRYISGITQPSVLATCVRLMFERDGDEQAVRQLLPGIARWHEWFERERCTPDSGGEPVVVHPWESGRDNAPEWDVPLDASPVAREPFQRVDTDHVAAAQRPTKAHYDHYVGLVEWMRDRAFDQRELAMHAPFRVLDTATTCILAAACGDLAWLAGQLQEGEIAEQAHDQRDRLVHALEARMSADGSIPCVDLTTGRELAPASCAQALLALAPGIDERCVDHAASLVTTGGTLHSPYGVCSSARDDAGFDHLNYWRGPVWANITWLSALGFERAGRQDIAADLRARLLDFTRTAGMREYCNPDTGSGLGASDFTWTAALTAWELTRD